MSTIENRRSLSAVWGLVLLLGAFNLYNALWGRTAHNPEAWSALLTASSNVPGDLSRMQAWAGQSAHLARAEPARVILQRLWDDAIAILRY
jgi:hypothetical protein